LIRKSPVRRQGRALNGENTMKKQPWSLPVVVSLALVACAQEPRSGPGGGQQGDDPLPATAQQKCQGNGNCGIDVTITCPGCKGSVPKRVDVFNDIQHSKTITWKLTGDHQQFRFKDQKIDLNDAVFSCERPSQDRKQITCTDLFTAAGSSNFQYQLHVEKVGGGDLTIDPWIVNR
jgi:hypothetical protein